MLEWIDLLSNLKVRILFKESWDFFLQFNFKTSYECLKIYKQITI